MEQKLKFHFLKNTHLMRLIRAVGFSKTGMVYDSSIPVTHTGAMVEYTWNGAYAKAMAVNPSGKGSNGSSVNSDDNTEYGAVIGYSNSMIRGQFGMSSRPISKADHLGSGNRTLMDMILGTTIGAFSVDAEYAMVKDPSKNTLTSSDTTDEEKMGTAAMLLGSYKIGEIWTLGARYEHIADDPASSALVGVRSADAYGAAVHFRLSNEILLRSEYIQYNNKGVNDLNWTDNRFSVSTLVSF